MSPRYVKLDVLYTGSEKLLVIARPLVPRAKLLSKNFLVRYMKTNS
jgi:hypothetical protein